MASFLAPAWPSSGLCPSSRVLTGDQGLQGEARQELPLIWETEAQKCQGFVQGHSAPRFLRIRFEQRQGYTWTPGQPNLQYLEPLGVSATPGTPAFVLTLSSSFLKPELWGWDGRLVKEGDRREPVGKVQGSAVTSMCIHTWGHQSMYVYRLR